MPREPRTPWAEDAEDAAGGADAADVAEVRTSVSAVGSRIQIRGREEVRIRDLGFRKCHPCRPVAAGKTAANLSASSERKPVPRPRKEFRWSGCRFCPG
jgi:hypothetical protein